LDTGYGGALLQRYSTLVTYMGNGGFLCGLWANGIDRELKGGGKGLEMDIYTYIYRVLSSSRSILEGCGDQQR